MPRETKTPVLVVGAGPVGLALAGDLGWRSIPCVLIEQSDGSIYQPRMDLVGIRTMEFCRRWGLVGAVEASPYPRDLPQDNVYVTSLAGHELGRERKADRAGADDEDGGLGFARHGPCPSLRGAIDLGFTRDRHLTMRKSGKPDLRATKQSPASDIHGARLLRSARNDGRYFGRFISLEEFTTACRLRARSTALGTSMVMA